MQLWFLTAYNWNGQVRPPQLGGSVSRGAREIAAEIGLRPRRSLAFWVGLIGTILAFVVGLPMPSWALFFLAIGIAQAVVGVLAGIQGFEGQVLRRFAAGVATPIVGVAVFILVFGGYEGGWAGASEWFLVFLLVLSFATALGLAVGRRLRPAGASVLTSRLRQQSVPNRLVESPRQPHWTGDHGTEAVSPDGDLGLGSIGVTPETNPWLADTVSELEVDTGHWRLPSIVRQHRERPDELRIELETAVMRDHGYEMTGRERVVGDWLGYLVASFLNADAGIDTVWIDVTYERRAIDGVRTEHD